MSAFSKTALSSITNILAKQCSATLYRGKFQGICLFLQLPGSFVVDRAFGAIDEDPGEGRELIQ